MARRVAGTCPQRDEGIGHTCPATAMHLETRSPLSDSRVVIMPNLQDFMKVTRSCILVSRSGSWMFFSLYLKDCEHLFRDVTPESYGSAG